jgi:hypothetical protein
VSADGRGGLLLLEDRSHLPRLRRRILLPSATPGWRWLAGIAAGTLAAGTVGVGVASVRPMLAILALAALLLGAAVVFHPPLAAYLLIGITPLVAGIDRGRVIPVVRPNEALALLVGAALVARGIALLRSGSLPRLRLGSTDVTILLLAVTSSILPLAWMLLRGQAVEQDDLLYALMIWKYYGVFLIIRASIRTERQVRACLWISMIAASVVAVIAILQSLQLFGVTRILSSYYTPYGSVQALQNNRGGSTLSLPIAVADLMTFNLAIAVGFLARERRNRGVLLALGGLFVVGVVAAGEFSGLLGLVVGVVIMSLAARRVRPLAGFVPGFVAAGYLLRPVIDRRLSGFQSVSGMPTSWAGRLYNLQNYFWPQLFSGGNFILGVRPAARVATSTMATGYIWIESGYTWLLWSGGIPLLLAFLYFLWANVRSRDALARLRDDAVGVAALAAVTALLVIGLLMVLDPHLTYRGSADLVFALLALSLSERHISRGQADAEAPEGT